MTFAAQAPHDLREFNHIGDVPVQAFVKSIDCESIVETLMAVPHAFRSCLLAEYERLYSDYQRENKTGEYISFEQARLQANQYFLKVRHDAKGRTFLNSSDASLRTKAQRLARSATRQINQTGLSAALQLLDAQQIDAPNADSLESLKARLMDEQWWLYQLIKKYDRQFEHTAIRLGRVRKHKQVYVSNETLEKIINRQKRALALMEKKVAISDHGDEVDMLDILKASPANPAVRRAELMNRLYGFEQYADAHHHIAEFYTLTAPSIYHANSSRYNEWTPRQVQQDYFSPLWARIRAKLKYEGLPVYGFRIAEAHGDACPHWHILLFMPKQEAPKVRAILKDYALRESGDEKGAAQNRFDVETIRKEKGSAIAYIAKYIAKNVDGFGMENETEDETGIAINASAQRVRAWASVWGIRQFQQIGGCSITVWRELRRLKKSHPDPIIEAARHAADSGDWQAYLEAQGGTDTLRKDHLIKPYRCSFYNPDTGAVHMNQYGEIVAYIQGVMTTGTVVETRLKQWTIQTRSDQTPSEEESPADANTAQYALEETVECGIQRILTSSSCSTAASTAACSSSEYAAAPLDNTAAAFDRPAVDLPWSSVNNCRKPRSQPIRESDYLAKELEIEYRKRLKAGEKFPMDCETFVKDLLKKV